MADCSQNSFTYTCKLDNSKSSVEARTVLECRNFTPFFSYLDDTCIQTVFFQYILYKEIKMTNFLNI